jgi:hypothetical protein
VPVDVPLSDAELATLTVNLQAAARNGGAAFSPLAAGTLLRLVAEVERCRQMRIIMAALVADCCGPLVDRRFCEQYGCGTLQSLLDGGDGLTTLGR